MEVPERLARRVGTGADVALAGVLALTLAFDTERQARQGGAWPLGLTIGLVIAGAALLRGRARIWATAIGLAAFLLSAVATPLWGMPPEELMTAPIVGLLVLAFSSARSLPARQAVLVTIVGSLVVAGVESTHAVGSFAPHELLALFGATLWASASAVGVWLRYVDRRQQAAVEAKRREERLELARELHDVVAHHVTGIVVQAQAAQFAGQDHAGALASIEEAGADTLTAMRRLVGLLRDPDDTAGTTAGPEPLTHLVERFTRHGPPVELRTPPDLSPGAWPPEVASTVYRVVQESLTNVARHAANARSVTVTITDRGREVAVAIADDAGPGGRRPARTSAGYGLVGMRERVEALGGTLRAGPRDHAGWAVEASLPVPARTQP